LFDKGTVYALLGQPDQAIATYTAVIELNEKHDESYAQRGTLRIAAGDVEGARADFAKALALNGRNHTAAVGAQALHVARALDALATKK
jgi:tetratricopeptide (TPR) repeat protein